MTKHLPKCRSKKNALRPRVQNRGVLTQSPRIPAIQLYARGKQYAEYLSRLSGGNAKITRS